MSDKVFRYRKKPLVIDAIQYKGKYTLEIEKFIPTPNSCYEADGKLYIRTLEGDMCVKEGDYVIKGIAGEFYSCKPDIFEITYEKEEEDENKI